MERIKQIEKEIEEIRKIIDLKESVWDNSKPYDEYSKYLRPENKKISELNRELRMINSIELEELPNYGDVMSLEHFIKCVKSGGFIDYDGSGNYVKDGKMTNIEIYPSDVKHKSIRKGFDTIIWFNR